MTGAQRTRVRNRKAAKLLTACVAALPALTPAGWSQQAIKRTTESTPNGTTVYSTSSTQITEKEKRILSPEEIRKLNIRTTELQRIGNYAEASKIFEKVVAAAINTKDLEKTVLATLLNKLASLYFNQGFYSKAEPLYIRALDINEKALGSIHPETAASLNGLARLYYRQGFYSKAEPLYIRTLDIREKMLSPTHPSIAIALNDLALLYFRQGLYSKAEPLYIRALDIIEKTLGPNHPEIASSLNNLALLYDSQGSYNKAEPLYIRALAIIEKTLGPTHPNTAVSLNNLALLYNNQGFYGKAEPLYIRALAINEKALGPIHAETATSLHNLAFLYSKKGLFNKAEPLYIRALDILEKTLGPNHLNTATILNNLADLYHRQGLYSKTEPLYIRILDIREKALSPTHPRIAISLNNLALLYFRQGLYSKAEPLFARALAINEKALGLIHPETATSLNNLGLLYFEQRLYKKAEPLFIRALAINEKALGPIHPETATNLNNLASLYSNQGFHSKAESLYIRALDINEKALGPIHPETAASLNNVALHYNNIGFYSKAEPLYIRALAINEKVLGPAHPETAANLNNLAALYIDQGSYNKAQPFLRRGITSETKRIQTEAPYLAIRDRQSFLYSLGKAYVLPFSINHQDQEYAGLAMFSRLNRQGLLQEIEQRQSLLSRLPGRSKTIAEQLRLLNIQLSSATLLPEQRKITREQLEKLQQQLYRDLPALKPRIVDLSDVTTKLPDDGALIELQKYQPFDGRKPKQQRWGESRYLALILKPNGSVTPVQLGAAAPIESAIRQALQASASSNSDDQQLWKQVSDLVLKPLAPAIASSHQWFISPDAELNRVPFAALPSPLDTSKTLNETVQVRLLTTGRDLLRLQQPATSAQAPAVVANPDFGWQERSGPAVVIASNNGPSQTRSGDLGVKAWAPLPASQQEGQRIASLLGTRAITGSKATTTHLQQLKSPKILHIASHGFFVGDVESEPGDPLLALQDQSAMLQPFRSEDPQLRSGIVLAGANQPDADPNDDGYLTAAEAVGLQLDGTELVVLSACNTGQGDIRTGEGVYGLQRSLTVAGARSTLLSLWKVDDAATAEFMTRFYTRLKAGEARSDALAATQKEFRDGVAGNGEWTDPYYWAAWQLVGDWRPIKGL